MKTKIIITLLLAFLIFFVLYEFLQNKTDILQNTSIKEEKIKTDTFKVDKFEGEQSAKKLNDTIVILYFKDLSNIYNYQIKDKYHSTENKNYYDSVLRVIKIFNKNDSLVQKIYPDLQMTPWYFEETDLHLKLSRSFITGKNAKYIDIDNYCGEIVVADLNFDGLEDFATPIDCGADNGPHYAFYIQNKKNHFELNKYLTENLIWFPETINDSLLTFTNAIPCMVSDINYQTFKYDTIRKKWRKIEDYLIDINTGKLIK